MSTIAASTLEDRVSTDSTAVLNAVHGSAKAWCLYNQSTPAITNSFNLDSISDDATGEWTVTFTTDFANVNYVLNGTVAVTAAGGSAYNVSPDNSVKTVGTCSCVTKYNDATNNATRVDVADNHACFLGDQ